MTGWLRSLSIRTRIIVMVAGTLLLAQIVSWSLIRTVVNQNIVQQKIATADILTTSVLHDIKYAYGAGGMDGQKIIEKYMTYYRSIARMTIYDANLGLNASSDPRAASPTADHDVLAAVREARPTLAVYRSREQGLSVRSVAPILQGSRIIGALVLEISIRDAQQTLAAIDKRLATIMLMKLVLVSAALYLLLRGSILNRLGRLTAVTQEIAGGNYRIRVDDRQRDEIGTLAQAFNRMTADLENSKREIEDHNRHLEERVREATAQLQKAYEDLQNTQGQLVLNEKMASLGQLIAGIAHEINTPVGAILNVSRNLEKKIRTLPDDLAALTGDADLSVEAVTACLEDLIASACVAREPVPLSIRRQIEESLRRHGIARDKDKANTLCRLNVADLALIERHASCLRSEAFFSFADSCASIAQAARISETSSQKIAEIVRALKYYAYSDQDRIERIQINDSVRTALVLLRNQLKHAVHVVTDFDPALPQVACTSEIHQVWTNLLTNACDAVLERGESHTGEIGVRTFVRGDAVVVTVTDNGIGIPEHQLDRIFDPFVTTKDIGKGTGLGLSIVTGIVKKHRGAVRVESQPGRTVFEVELPVESGLGVAEAGSKTAHQAAASDRAA